MKRTTLIHHQTDREGLAALLEDVELRESRDLGNATLYHGIGSDSEFIAVALAGGQCVVINKADPGGERPERRRRLPKKTHDESGN